MFKKIITSLFLVLLGVGTFFGNVTMPLTSSSQAPISFELTTSYAATNAADKKAPKTSSLESMQNNIIEVLNIFLTFISAIISPLVLLIGWFMSPDWTAGDFFGLRVPMYELWVVVSNITYLVYAILLIFIALATMFNSEQFGYKIMLRKLALGIILVPFTWWFVQGTISLASIVTASVITIPTETITAMNSEGTNQWFSERKSIPKEIVLGTGSNNIESQIKKCPESGNCISPQEFLESSGGMYGPLVVYAFSVFNIQGLKNLDSGSLLDAAKMGLNIINGMLVSSIMFIVFGFLSIALAFVLIARAFKLWVYAIFSPLFTFRMALGDKASSVMGGQEKTFSIGEFFGLAFVPAIIGLALSMGLVIISAIQGPQKKGQETSTQKCTIQEGNGDSCVLVTLMGSPDNKIMRYLEPVKGSQDKITVTEFKWGKMSIKFKGKVASSTTEQNTTQHVIDAFGGTFGTVIVNVMALMFIYIAFKAATHTSEAVKSAAEPFMNIGSSIGRLVKQMPQYAPILPKSMGGSAYGVARSVEGIQNAIRGNAQRRYEESYVGKWSNNITGKKGSKTIENSVNVMKNTATKMSDVQNDMKQYGSVDTKDVIEAFRRDTAVRKQIGVRLRNDAGFSGDEVKKILEGLKKDATIEQELLLMLALQEGRRSDWSNVVTWSENQLRLAIDNNTQNANSQGSTQQSQNPSTNPNPTNQQATSTNNTSGNPGAGGAGGGAGGAGGGAGGAGGAGGGAGGNP